MARLLKISPDVSRESILHDAATILLDGGAVAYPTETFYGLGVDATSESAVCRIFDIKGRNFKNPVSVIIGSIDQLAPIVSAIPPSAQKLMDTFWPGPLTIVFKASDRMSQVLTAGTGKIGVRLSSHDFARQLALETGRPITATSANLSGAPECATADDVIRQLGDKIDAVIDLEERGGAIGSTIVDATTDPLVILRSGLITAEDIQRKTGLSRG
jgi:L-threonylcarbamoyladenylate synthase